SLDREAASETMLPRPLSYYGISKLAAEQYLTLAAKTFNEQIRVTSLRMFNVYGPMQSLRRSDQGVVGVFVGAALRGEPIKIYGTGLQRRDFIYIDDVVRAWMLALDNPELCEPVINVGSGCSRSILEVAKTVLAASGRDPFFYDIVFAPPFPEERETIRCD